MYLENYANVWIVNKKRHLRLPTGRMACKKKRKLIHFQSFSFLSHSIPGNRFLKPARGRPTTTAGSTGAFSAMGHEHWGHIFCPLHPFLRPAVNGGFAGGGAPRQPRGRPARRYAAVSTLLKRGWWIWPDRGRSFRRSSCVKQF